MSSARIVLTGLRAAGRHGASPRERSEPQEFVLDVDVTLDVGADSLQSTVDYRVLASTARETVEKTSFHLLETLAEAVARAVHEHSGVVRATVVVHKPRAARSVDGDDVRAEVTIS